MILIRAHLPSMPFVIPSELLQMRCFKSLLPLQHSAFEISRFQFDISQWSYLYFFGHGFVLHLIQTSL